MTISAQRAEKIRIERTRSIWRLVRDAGAKGIALVDLLPQITGSKQYVNSLVGDMVRAGFLRKQGWGRPLQVDWDCRVPAGEEARLGPGWPPLSECAEGVEA